MLSTLSHLTDIPRCLHTHLTARQEAPSLVVVVVQPGGVKVQTRPHLARGTQLPEQGELSGQVTVGVVQGTGHDDRATTRV